MKAVHCTRYGSTEVLEIVEILKPTPKENEVLVKIHAATVALADIEMRAFKFRWWTRPLMRLGFGFRGPRNKILGQDFSGKIEAIGDKVKKFKVGDQIMANTGIGFAAHAQYKCINENKMITLKPESMSYQEATTLPLGGWLAWIFLKRVNIQEGQDVIIVGGGGTVGTYAIQIAKHLGAEVTAVDKENKFEMMKSIGATYVIDYTKEDFTKTDKTYDVIFDIVGEASYGRCIKSLKENGVLLNANPKLITLIRGPLTSWRSKKKVYSWVADESAEELDHLRKLVDKGAIKAVVDKVYTIDEIKEAHRRVESGEKLGHIIIIMDHES